MSAAEQIFNILFPETSKIGKIWQVLKSPVEHQIEQVVIEPVVEEVKTSFSDTLKGGACIVADKARSLSSFLGLDAINRRTLLTVGGALAAYYIIKNRSIISSIDKKKRLIFKDDDDHANVAKPGIVLESIKPDSPEVKLTPKRGEILVCGVNKETDYYPVGKAIRVYDMVVMPEHVLMAARYYDKVLLVNAVDETKEQEIPHAEVPTHLETDLVGFSFDQIFWSKLGVIKPAIGPIMRPTNVQISNVAFVGSYGKISIDTKEFGRTEFTGTTKKGYSGACYFQANMVMAMHLAGGSKNSGYSMNYIALLVRTVLKMTHEDTEDFLDQMFKTGEVEYSNSPLSPDEVFVYRYGAYHAVERGKYNAAHERYLKANEWRNDQYEDGQSDVEDQESDQDFHERRSRRAQRKKNSGGSGTRTRRRN